MVFSRTHFVFNRPSSDESSASTSTVEGPYTSQLPDLGRQALRGTRGAALTASDPYSHSQIVRGGRIEIEAKDNRDS